MRTTTAATLCLLLLISKAAVTPCGVHLVFTLDPINFSSYYTFTTPAHTGPRDGSISFTLYNDQADYATQCAASSPMPFGVFYASQTFVCTTPTGAGLRMSSFSYDSASKVISVNSTWTCGSDVVPYTTTTSGTVNLQCKETTWKNPNWQIGEIYSNTSTICQPGSLILQG